MRIITYNLRFGGSGNSHWSKVFEDFAPDIFLVQESYDPIEHLPPLLHDDLHRDACWKCVEGLKWGSAVRNVSRDLRQLRYDISVLR